MFPQLFIFKNFWLIALVMTLLNTVLSKIRSRKHIAANPELAQGYNPLILGYTFWSSLPWLVMGFGMETGHVSSLFDYFQPREGNPYVMAFFVCVVVEWILLILWMFFLGGAEKLCRYQGVFNRRFSSPAALKIFTLLGILGGVAALSMMWCGFFPSFPPHK